jgi:hypothetical protein
MSDCRRFAKFSGNYRGHHNRNQHSSGQNRVGCHRGNIYGKNFHGSHQGGNKYQKRRRNREGSAQYTEKASSEGGAGNTYEFFVSMIIVKCSMGFAGYVSVCVQLYCVGFHCLSLHVSAYMAIFRRVGYFIFICLKETTKITKENSTGKTQMKTCRV